MKVAVGSQNPTKLEATQLAFHAVFPNEQWEIIAVDVASGIPNQPTYDEQTIKGATNRAKRALKKTNADYGVGLEGGIHQIGADWFETGWIVIVNKQGHIGKGSSVRMPLPKAFFKLIQEGIELGVATDMIFKTHDSKSIQGFFGIMTNNQITRAKGYGDGVIAALSSFLHSDLF